MAQGLGDLGTGPATRQFWQRLSYKQTRAAVILGLILGVLFSGLQIGLDVERVERETDRRFRQILMSIEEAAFQAAFNLDPKLAQRVVDGLFQYPAIRHARIYDNMGDRVAERSRPMRDGGLRSLAELIFSESGRYGLELGPRQVDWVVGVLEIQIDRYVVAETFLERSGVVLASGVLRNLILAAFLAVLFHAMLTRPLAGFVSAIRAGEDTVPVPDKHREDDFGELVAAYNQMKRTQKASEIELRTSEARFADFAASASDWFWELDAELRFTYASDALFGICAARPEELFGQTWQLVASRTGEGPEDAAWARFLGLLERREPVRESEHEILNGQGDLRHISISGRPVYGADGGFSGYRGTGRDITVRKLAEAALREGEARLRATLESAPIGFVVVDRRGLVDMVNPAAERIFGFAAGEIVGRPLSGLLSQTDGGEAALDLAALPELDPSDTANSGREAVGRRKDGTAFPMHLGVGLMRLGAEPEYVLSIADLTELRALEAQLSQAQKLDSIGQLTGGVAHDMNNILGVVILNLELARERAQTGALSKLIDSALSASERGARLTHRLLAFARRQPLAPEIIEPAGLIDGMQELLHRSLGEDVDIQIVHGEDLWPCLADPIQLETALLNLAVNGRDAMPRGGRLTIETANAAFDDDYVASHSDVTAGEFVSVAVSDTGGGMTPEVIEKAFDPFFTTKDIGQGTGLGLSMVHGFMKQSGGHVRIYSEAGEGTTIKLYLPRAGEESARIARPGGAEPEAEAAGGRGEHILVVEDDPELRSVISRQIGELGYRAEVAEDGAQALEVLAAKADIRLLLTDVVLPGGMSGRELAEQAQERQPDLLVVYMSGYTENAIIHQGRLDKGVILLQKPFRRELLKTTLRTLLDGA